METKHLEEIEERLSKVNKSNWVPCIEGRDFTSGSSFIMTMNGDRRGDDIEIIGASDTEIDFIGHAKQDIATLLDEVYRLRGKILSLGGDVQF